MEKGSEKVDAEKKMYHCHRFNCTRISIQQFRNRFKVTTEFDS